MRLLFNTRLGNESMLAVSTGFKLAFVDLYECKSKERESMLNISTNASVINIAAVKTAYK